jgi:hypothetical protein
MGAFFLRTHPACIIRDFVWKILSFLTSRLGLSACDLLPDEDSPFGYWMIAASI